MNRDLTSEQAYAENVITPTLDAIRRSDEEEKRALVQAIAKETQQIADELTEFMPAFGLGEMDKGKIFYQRDADGYVIVGVADYFDGKWIEGIANHYGPDGKWIGCSRHTYQATEVSWITNPCTMRQETVQQEAANGVN